MGVTIMTNDSGADWETGFDSNSIVSLTSAVVKIGQKVKKIHHFYNSNSTMWLYNDYTFQKLSLEELKYCCQKCLKVS